MRNLVFLAAFTLLSTAFVSCDKDDDDDEGKLPNISFKHGSGYVSADTSVARSQAVKIGIDASKAEDKDVLTRFTIVRTINGGSDSTLFTKDLTGSEGNAYSYDFVTSTRSAIESEKFKFTVVNRDGLINTVNLTLNVQ